MLSSDFGVGGFGTCATGAHPGILPLGKRLTFDLDLIGHGTQKDGDCGKWLHWRKIGCLDVEAHNSALNPEYHGKVAIYLLRQYCKRPDCPVCFEKWVSITSKKSCHRLKYYSRKIESRPIHVTLSPPLEQLLTIKTVDGLFRKAKQICQAYNIKDGSLVYHSKSRICNHCGKPMPPRKNRCPACGGWGWSWVFNPHFHFFGFGWLPNWESKIGIQAKDLYKKYRWVVKNLRVRKTISGTFWYELSHCAFLGRQKMHIRWIGGLTNKDFKPPKYELEPKKCPICGQKLRRVCHIDALKIEEREDIQFFEPIGWYYKDEPPPDIARRNYERTVTNSYLTQEQEDKAWEDYQNFFK